MSKFWNEETVATLTRTLDKGTEVAVDTVEALAELLDTTTRSVSAKLRNLGYTVQKVVDAKTSAWSAEATQELQTFLERNPGKYTFAEIAASFRNGEFSTKAVQGKVLSLEMTDAVKKAEKVATVKTYSDDEEAKLIKLASNGASLEDIADALGRSLNSVRGKALSLSRSIDGFTIPKQAKSYAKPSEGDVYDALGSRIGDMTVAEIAEKTGRTERGVKTTLTRRGITVQDYDGAKKAAKAAEKRAIAE